MALKAEDFDFISNFNSLWPIILGALLATFGGLVGGQLEWFLESRRRERDAALFFGEVLSTLKILIDFAADTRKVGDPYGPITLRFLRSARREIDTYERNRENLYVLRDGEARARLHTLMLRLAMPIDGVLDSTEAIDALSLQLKAPGLTSEHRQELEKRIETIRDNRDTGFDFVVETAGLATDLALRLGEISGRALDSVSIERVVRSA